jgi:molybdopterin-biosynthesis enzyme MoeA-like protein
VDEHDERRVGLRGRAVRADDAHSVRRVERHARGAGRLRRGRGGRCRPGRGWRRERRIGAARAEERGDEQGSGIEAHHGLLGYHRAMARSAAALIIGNEILTGKVPEQNVAFLGRELFALGVTLRRVVVCPDEVPTIVRELDGLRAAHDLVFTSGGIGPTHDDVTLEAVAAAFGRPLVRSAEIEALIRGHFGERTHEGHLRMADVPEGCELVKNDAMPWPTVCLQGVYVMPGVPEIFRMKFDVLRPRIAGGTPYVSRALYTTKDEFEIAALLTRVAAQSADVAIGSYPTFRSPEYKVKVTFDGQDGAAVERALAAVRDGIGEGAIVRVE